MWVGGLGGRILEGEGCYVWLGPCGFLLQLYRAHCKDAVWHEKKLLLSHMSLTRKHQEFQGLCGWLSVVDPVNIIHMYAFELGVKLDGEEDGRKALVECALAEGVD